MNALQAHKNNHCNPRLVTVAESNLCHRVKNLLSMHGPALLNQPLYATQLETPLGCMVAIADDTKLFFLGFNDQRWLERSLRSLTVKTKRPLIVGTSALIDQLTNELAAYFAGTLTEFTIPYQTHGSPFQESIWSQLKKISHGTTFSYASLAHASGNPKAVRAAGLANGANPLSIIIPCHRVISSNKTLGGYGGGLTRKQWLLNHEKR